MLLNPLCTHRMHKLFGHRSVAAPSCVIFCCKRVWLQVLVLFVQERKVKTSFFVFTLVIFFFGGNYYTEEESHLNQKIPYASKVKSDVLRFTVHT